MNVVVINHLSLDGVMQAPGRADEDTRGGFEHGGWSAPYGDALMGEAMSARRLIDSTTTTTGVLIATYRPSERANS